MAFTKLMKRGSNQESKLTDKQRMFVAEYLVDFNSKRAALKAGYSKKTAHAIGTNLLQHPIIKRLIGNAQKQRLDGCGLERENVLKRLSHNLNRTSIRALAPSGIFVTSMDEIPDEVFAYIDGFDVTQTLNEDGEVVGQKIKIRRSPNAQAQDMAMKHIGAYAAEKHQVVGKAVIDYELLSKPVDPMTLDVVSKRLEAESSPSSGNGDGS